METILVAAEAVLSDTRERVEELTVSALQQAHAMSHAPRQRQRVSFKLTRT